MYVSINIARILKKSRCRFIFICTILIEWIHRMLQSSVHRDCVIWTRQFTNNEYFALISFFLNYIFLLQYYFLQRKFNIETKAMKYSDFCLSKNCAMKNIDVKFMYNKNHNVPSKSSVENRSFNGFKLQVCIQFQSLFIYQRTD